MRPRGHRPRRPTCHRLSADCYAQHPRPPASVDEPLSPTRCCRSPLRTRRRTAVIWQGGIRILAWRSRLNRELASCSRPLVEEKHSGRKTSRAWDAFSTTVTSPFLTATGRTVPALGAHDCCRELAPDVKHRRCLGDQLRSEAAWPRAVLDWFGSIVRSAIASAQSSGEPRNRIPLVQ